ncbi:SRPBCC family protein [Kitasatospora sp. NPDC047058]|uniref:SRPBCC family protein n=1 Tax=Kitasatospora sp. NPDC047058 TaxID=3155620 RepID=UPI0033DB1015
MDPNHYRFRDTWRLPAPPAAVYAALEDVRHYPLWWPEILAARDTGAGAGGGSGDGSGYGSGDGGGGGSGEVVVRALLPYRLVIGLEAVRRDPVAGVLEVAMHGDLTGWSRWTVSADGTGSRALFEEDTRPGKPLLRRLALPLHLVFRANHAVMMRRGRRGLAAYLTADN